MSVKDYVEYRMKKESVEKLADLIAKVNQGRDAIKNMESSINQIQGAIQQCNWTLDQFELKDDK